MMTYSQLQILSFKKAFYETFDLSFKIDSHATLQRKSRSIEKDLNTLNVLVVSMTMLINYWF